MGAREQEDLRGVKKTVWLIFWDEFGGGGNVVAGIVCQYYFTFYLMGDQKSVEELA